MAGLGWWSSLDPAAQECVQSAADGAGAYQRELSLELANGLQATMEEEGAQFAEIEDRQAFIDATQPVYDRYAEQFPDIVSALREATQ